MLLVMRFLACVMIISWSICLTNPYGLNANSVHSELASAHFLAFAYFYHIELLKHMSVLQLLVPFT